MSINKTHDKMKQEVRSNNVMCTGGRINVFFVVTPYFKQKLVGLYTNALADAKNEVGYVDTLKCVQINFTPFSPSTQDAGPSP